MNPTSSSTVSTERTHRDPPQPIPIDRIDPDALKVVRRLKRYGHTAYLVGGCVRDLLLGRTPKDFDIGTTARPRQVKHLFRNSRIIGRRFRLVHVVFGRKVIEVATFRATQEPPELPELPEEMSAETPEAGEPEAAESAEAADRDGEDLLIRSDNVFGTPVQDAFRRDFTVNALFYDPETEQVIDHVGGLADLERRVLRTIGDPDVRFKEDPVRIVRAVKFAARLHFAIEPRTFEAMVRNQSEIARAAAPRLAEEVVRLAQGGAGAESFRLAHDLGILPRIAPAVAQALTRAGSGSPDHGPHGLFWRHLEAIDRWPRGPSDLSRATILACVYGPVYRSALDGSPQAMRDPGAAFFNAIRPVIGDRLLSRREADRIKLIYVAQRRLDSAPGPGEIAAQGMVAPVSPTPGGRRRRRRRGGGGRGMAGRDYFREAVAFFRLDAVARGKPPEAWQPWEALLPQAPPTREVLPFRRRAEERVPDAEAHLPEDEGPPPSPEEIEALNRLPDDEEAPFRRRGRFRERGRDRGTVSERGPAAESAAAGPPEAGAAAPANEPRPEPLVAPATGPDGQPLPKLKKPPREPRPERHVAARAPAPPPAPPAPKLPPSERVARAMASDVPLINPYTGRVYVPRKIYDEPPAAPPSTGGMGEISVANTMPTAPVYTLAEFDRRSDEETTPVTPPPVDVGAAADRPVPAPEPRAARSATAAEASPERPSPHPAPNGAPGEGRRRRRRRGRRGRGRRGPGGAPSAGGGSA